MNKAPMHNLFTSATVRLTVWYMAVVMLLSLLFSVVLYNVGTNEVSRVLGPRPLGETALPVDNDVFEARRQRVEESSGRLLLSLVFFNLAVLVGGTALSYMLARQTLRPIEEAHEAQGRFTSDAAHELRTPLTVMQTELEVTLRDKQATKEQCRKTLESNLEEVTRLKTLTERLLLLATKQELPLGQVDLESAAVEAVTRIVPLAQKKRIEIENTVENVTAHGNTDAVVDILGILLDNAIKYSPEKSRVTIASSVSGKTVEVSVTDQGAGIATEEQTKVFERFYRVDDSRSKVNVEGHGLGLSLAERLAEEMGGSMSLRSDGKNGSTFTLRLSR